MPCFITGSEAGDAKLEADEAREAATKVTRLLCGLCERIDELDAGTGPDISRYGDLISCNQDLAKWWKEHKKIDSKRRKNS